MRAWLALIGNSIRRGLAWRANLVYGALWLLLEVFIQVTIWTALYHGRDVVSGATLPDMVTYVVIANLSGLAVQVHGGRLIEDRIKSGDFASDLMLPVDYRLVLLFDNLGGILFRIVVSGLPMVLGVVLFLHVGPPASAVHLLAFLVTLAGAFLISSCLELVKGTMAFWAMRPGTLEWIFDGLGTVFGGRFIPLWFFPPWLARIGEFLPFRMTQFVPAAVYLGKIGAGGLLAVVGQQALWVAGLLVIQEVLWRRGMRRITVYGG